jgi:two-component system sensor histidine kinase SenX3
VTLAWLLVLVGGAVGFGAGWWLGRWRPAVGDPPATASPRHDEPTFSDVVEHHPTGVVVANAAGAVTYRNAAARSLAGTHVGVLIDAAIERHLHTGRGGQVGEEVVELYGPPKRVLDVVSRPLPAGGSVVFVDDITERRRLDQVRTDFVANISHELKTPIGALSVLAETLVDETDPATVTRVVDRMMSEAQRASSTIDDLMELSRIELGGDRVSEPVRLADVVRAAVDRVTQLAAQREITIVATGAGLGGVGVPITVAGDRPQLVSAVGNLVENAVKYSERHGHVEVRVEATDEWLEISVIDAGVGIPQRDLSRIFERFYRVDRARSRETGGTGLGLSIVRHVATNHGGAVVVSSIEGQGSTFVLRLPVHLALDVPPHDQPQHEHPQEGAA